jgi:hypothetical protein
MKKNFIFSLLILLSFSLSAQIKSNHKHNGNNLLSSCSEVNNETSEKISQNKILGTKIYLNNPSIGNKDLLMSETKYNNSGLPIEKSSYNFEGKQTSRRTFKYDNKGNATEVSDYNENMALTGKVIKKYDEFGRVIERIEKDNSGKNLWRLEKRYNTNGNIEEEQGYSENNVLVSVNSYVYDSGGRLTEEIVKNGTGKVLSRITYVYNASGKLTEEKVNNLENKYINKYKYTYDSEGKVTGYQRLYGESEVIENFQYRYDTNGNTIETEYNDKGGIHTILSSKYDVDNNKTEEILRLADGSISSKTTFIYDKNGNEAEELQWDSKSGQVKMSNKFVYEFNK